MSDIDLCTAGLMRIVLVGEESAGLNVLRWLATTGHDVAAVLTGRVAGEPTPLAGAAERLGLPVRSADAVRGRDFADWLQGEGVDLLLNVHSLFKISPEALLVPKIGSFNLHPGPLPRYAGLNAPSWAIYCGETSHGTTIHWMSAEIDAGAIAYQKLFEVTPEDTGISLSMKCIRLGVPLVSNVVEAATVGRKAIPRIEQDPSERTYFPPGPPDNGRVPWSASARKVVDLVRAADYLPFPSPWGHPWTTLGRERLEITKASSTGESTRGRLPGTVGAVRAKDALVAASDQWVLIERVRIAGAPGAAGDVLEHGMTLGV
jgi:methionyl-tRNA formyltransferase